MKPTRSNKYLKHIRGLPCLRCHHPAPVDAHHFGRHGVGTKASDFETVPLCRGCHDEFHRTGELRPFSPKETKAWFYKTALENIQAFIEEHGWEAGQ